MARYTTLDRVKKYLNPELITGEGQAISDTDILSGIFSASAQIETWTRRIFRPLPETVVISGRGFPLVSHPNKYDILELDEFRIIEDRSTAEYREGDRIVPGFADFPESHRAMSPHQTYLRDSFEGVQTVSAAPGQSLIRIPSRFGRIPKGAFNIQLRGWWGTLEERRKVELETLENLPAFSAISSIKVSSLVDDSGGMVSEGDSLAIVMTEASGFPVVSVDAIVTEISPGVDEEAGTYTISFDPIPALPVTVEAGPVAYRWGRVPEDIKTVATFVAVRDVMRVYAERTGDVSSLVKSAMIDGTLRSETTDSYSYSMGGFGDNRAGYGSHVGAITGSQRMDLLLRRWVSSSLDLVYL